MNKQTLDFIILNIRAIFHLGLLHLTIVLPVFLCLLTEGAVNILLHIPSLFFCYFYSEYIYRKELKSMVDEYLHSKKVTNCKI